MAEVSTSEPDAAGDARRLNAALDTTEAALAHAPGETGDLAEPVRALGAAAKEALGG